MSYAHRQRTRGLLLGSKNRHSPSRTGAWVTASKALRLVSCRLLLSGSSCSRRDGNGVSWLRRCYSSSLPSVLEMSFTGSRSDINLAPHPLLFKMLISPTLYRFFFSASFMTFLTIFCSSIKNARTTRSFTQLAQRLPPYAR